MWSHEQSEGRLAAQQDGLAAVTDVQLGQGHAVADLLPHSTRGVHAR